LSFALAAGDSDVNKQRPKLNILSLADSVGIKIVEMKD